MNDLEITAGESQCLGILHARAKWRLVKLRSNWRPIRRTVSAYFDELLHGREILENAFNGILVGHSYGDFELLQPYEWTNQIQFSFLILMESICIRPISCCRGDFFTTCTTGVAGA